MKQITFIGFSTMIVSFLQLWYLPFVQVREVSMQPTLQQGDLFILNRLHYLFFEVQEGDLLVFSRTEGEMLVKRCVLVSGSSLHWRENRLYIPYLDKYIRVEPQVRQNLRNLKRLPQGMLFVLGDNLDFSIDSRNYGLIPLTQIEGKPIWPHN